MKVFNIYTFLIALALSQSPVLSIPSPIAEGTNIDVVTNAPFVARDLNGSNLVAKLEEASSNLETRDITTCVSTALHPLSSSFLMAGKLGLPTKDLTYRHFA